MNTGKQINAMVVVLFLTVIAIGAYTIWDPFRSESAADEQVEAAANRGAETFALNCRLCHGDRGRGGALGGRLPQAPTLDQDFLRGFESGALSEEALKEVMKLVTNTITCGRVGTFMPTWGASQGGTLNEEQIRQLTVLITGGESEGFWDLAQEHADELDAEATGHATVQMPSGAFDDSVTELIVSNAADYSVDQYIRIDDERLFIADIPSTGQRLVEAIGRTPDSFLVSGADGTEVGAIIRLDGELMEITAIRDDGDSGTVLDIAVSPSDTLISVDDPTFFRPEYIFRVGAEHIRVIEAVNTGQTLEETVGRAQTTVIVSGSEGLSTGMVIRMGRELLRIMEIQPAFVEVDRGVDDTSQATHTAGAAILKAEVEEDEEPDTGQTLLEPTDANATTFVVTGMIGLAVDKTFLLGDEVVKVTRVEPARLRVERAADGTDREAHSRRASIFDRNLLNVERGIGGTPAAHDEGESVFLTILEVERSVAGSTFGPHSKTAEIFLGHRLTVERGVFGTSAAEHGNGVLVYNFPTAPVGPEPNISACGQTREIVTPMPLATPSEDAQVVNVSLNDDPFAVTPDQPTISEGLVYFLANNDGAQDHNFRVIATDLPPDGLPTASGGADEDALDVVASIPQFGVGVSQSTEVELVPGNYVLICNIPGHYGSGMFVGFEVIAQ